MSRKKKKKRTTKKNKSVNINGKWTNFGGLKDFFQRFEKLAELAGCKDACKLISKKNRFLMYVSRLHLTQPRVDKGEPINKKLAKILAQIFRSKREYHGIELIKGKEKISITDMYVIDCLNVLIRNEYDIELKETLESAFKPLIDAFNKLDPPGKLLYDMYDNILAMFNGFDYDMFSIKTSVISKDYPSAGVFHIVKVKHHRPIKRNITIDGKRRPIVKFGWPIASGTVSYFTIEAKRIKEIYTGDQKELDVYIQSHAIRRFEERTKPLSLILCRFSLAYLFRNYYVSTLHNGKIFLKVEYGGIKIGYFVADIIDEKVIIKTFLFVTHHSTPEGKALEQFSGLEKKEITYWHFDSLAAFLANPPEDGSLIKEIMHKAGVDQLFNLSELIGTNKISNDVDWTEVEEYIEKGREERLRIPKEQYEDEYF